VSQCATGKESVVASGDADSPPRFTRAIPELPACPDVSGAVFMKIDVREGSSHKVDDSVQVVAPHGDTPAARRRIRFAKTLTTRCRPGGRNGWF